MKKFISALVVLALVSSAAVFFVKMNEAESENAVIVVADSLGNNEDWQMWAGATYDAAPQIDQIELSGQLYHIDPAAQGPFVCGKVDENRVCYVVGE